MNITEHEMRGLLTGKCLPGDMRVNEELPAYLVRKLTELKESRDACMQAEMVWEKAMMTAIGEDGVGCVVRAIAELKAERDALAAENVTLKGYIEDECYIANPTGMDYIGAYASSVETPATDAFLNSVRAEGLKMAIDHMNNQTSDDCADVTVLPVIEMYNQLRAGKDGE